MIFDNCGMYGMCREVLTLNVIWCSTKNKKQKPQYQYLLLSPASWCQWNCISTWNPRSCSLGPRRKGIRKQLGGGWAVVRFPTESKSRRGRERHACLFLWECPLQSCVCVSVCVCLSGPSSASLSARAKTLCHPACFGELWKRVGVRFLVVRQSRCWSESPVCCDTQRAGKTSWVSARHRGSSIVQSVVLSESVTAAPARCAFGFSLLSVLGGKNRKYLPLLTELKTIEALISQCLAVAISVIHVCFFLQLRKRAGDQIFWLEKTDCWY